MKQLAPTMRSSVTCRGLVAGRLAIALAAASAATGCQQPLKPIFEPMKTPLAWPGAPAEPRIRYVGQITQAADLKPRPRFLQALTDLVVGPNAPEPLYGPRAVVMTADGSGLWVADPGGRCLHRFDLDTREYLRVVKVGEASLLTPVGLCAGPGESIYVCDSESVAIYRVSSLDGSLLATLRLPEDLLRPAAMYFDATRKELYVVDVSAHDIKVLSADGELLRILGQRGERPGQFNFPCDIASDGEVLWIADTGNQRVQAITRDGEPVTEFGSAGDAPGDLAMPKAVALDSDGHLYVVDARFENIQIFDGQGRVLLFFGQEGTGPGQFWLPSGITIDASDRIWVCDSYNNRLQVFDYLTPRAATPDPMNNGEAGAGEADEAGEESTQPASEE